MASRMSAMFFLMNQVKLVRKLSANGEVCLQTMFVKSGQSSPFAGIDPRT
jgi:hypothetical protein